MDSVFSLYIHFPFCASFCDYCDFYSVKTKNNNDEYIKAYLSALITDIKNQIKLFSVNEITTAYIGGGTPSLAGNKISFLLDELNRITCFKPAEFTIEANPESLTEDFLRLCRGGGINRLSLGVQTFHEPSRNAVSRKGDIKTIKENISLACKYFSGNLSFDLITGLPFQNEEIIKQDIKTLLAFEPSHISLYSLTIEDETPLKEKIRGKKVMLPDDDTADSLWLCGIDELKKAGFDHYEVSNFAMEGKECLHNTRYWQMRSWLGAGAAASGTIIKNENEIKRFTYANDIDAYIKNPFINSALCEEPDKDTFLKESLLMGYRCKEGPDPQVFKKRFGRTISDYIPNTLLKYKDKEKMLYLNSFLSDAFIELENNEL